MPWFPGSWSAGVQVECDPLCVQREWVGRHSVHEEQEFAGYQEGYQKVKFQDSVYT